MAKSDFVDAEAARARFHNLVGKRDSIRAVSGPLRDKRDALVQKARAEEDALNAQIKSAEDGLYEIDQEIGEIVTLLDGKTGEPPAKK